MENKIQSEIIVDLPLYRELVRGVQHANTRYIISRLLLIPLLIILAGSLNVSFVKYFLLMLTVFQFVILFQENRKDGGTAFQRMVHNNGDKPLHQIMEFGDDAVIAINRDNGNQLSFPYQDIVQIIDTGNLYILFYKYNQYNAIEKRWIKGCTPEELLQFLQSRCPNLKKKIRTPFLGKWLNRIFYVILVIVCVLSLYRIFCGYHPTNFLNTGSDMSYHEIAQVLEDADIHITDDMILQMEKSDAEYGLSESDYDTTQSKALHLLYWAGYGTYDEDTWQWIPPSTGILWYDCEVMNLDGIYGEFLTAVTALSHGELEFSNIQEDYGNADIYEGTGTVDIAFDYGDTTYHRTAQYLYDWFDTDFLFYLGRVIAEDDQQEDLYYCEDGQGFFLYYGTKAEAQILINQTNLPFVKAVNIMIR